jgi:hypothetical protein
MKIDLSGSVTTLTVSEEDLIPMLKEYIQRKLGAGEVKVDMCLNELCRVEFTPALQPTQTHKSMMGVLKDCIPAPPQMPPTKTVGGWKGYGGEAKRISEKYPFNPFEILSDGIHPKY